MRGPLDADRVRAHRVLASASQLDSQRGLATELVDHRLNWRPGPVDTRFSRVRLEHLSMAVLHYGAEVEVRPEPLREFVLVQMPLRGRADIGGRRGRVSVSPRMAGIVSPNHPVRLRWEAGCEQLLIKIPLAALREVARTALSIPERLLADGCFEFAPELDLATGPGRAWSHLVEGLLCGVPAPHSPDSPDAAGAAAAAAAAAWATPWRRHLEENAMLFLLTHQPNGLPAGLAPQNLPAGDDPLARLQGYIAARLCAPVSLLDLARAAGLGVRSLHSLCRERLQAPPMTVLRQARLDAARRRLLQGGQSVTEVAYAHGFEHLGRFSAYYRARFGELPSDTMLTVR